MTTQTERGLFALPRLSRKAALITSTATIMMMATPSAFAQTSSPDGSMIEITDNTPVINPGEGSTINVAAGVTQTIADTGSNLNANILLDGDGSNDDVVITNAGTLVNNDTAEQSGVITIDNAEDRTIITNTETGIFRGVNGVLFFEGDETTLNNEGTIEGTGITDLGVVHFDRDADGNLNIVNNSGTISSVGGPTIRADSALGSVPSSGDTANAAAAGEVIEVGAILNLDIINTTTGSIINTVAGDAIFFTGNAGRTSEASTSTSQRGCIENIDGGATNINCLFGIDIDNAGSISAADGIAIHNEDEAVITGTIDNASTGTISGSSAGIEIAGAQAEHDLAITNEGTISASAGDGLRITGDGVDLLNGAGATISGSAAGLLVSGSTATVREVDRNATNSLTLADNGSVDVAVAGINNTFTNAGTISGGTNAVDLSGAGEAVTFNQLGGGTLTGDFLGTTGFDDIFNVSEGTFTLTDDILQTVDVNVLSGGTLAFDGGNTIEGDLVSDGTLSFDLGNDAVVVNGDVTLNADSYVSLTDVSNQVTAVDQQFTLIDVADGATLINNATIHDDVEDDSLLLDFVAVTDANGDLVVQTQARETVVVVDPGDMDDDMMDDMTDDMMDDMTDDMMDDMMADDMTDDMMDDVVEEPAREVLVVTVADTNQQSFGQAVLGAFNTGALDGAAGFSQLVGLTNAADADDIATIIQENLPDEGNAPNFEIAEIVQDVNNIIGGRLNSLAGKTASFGGGTEQFAQSGLSLTDASNNYGSSNTGFWIQGGYRYARQSGDSSNGSTFNGYTADVVNFAIGYDRALTPDTLIGISGSYSTADTDERGGTAEAEIDLFQAILYGAKSYGPINVSAQASYSFGDVTAERATSTETIRGEYDVDGFNIEGEASYNFDLEGNGYIAPLVGLRYGNFSSDEFTEDGGFDAIIGGNTTDLFEGRVGAITGNKYVLNNSALDVYVHAAYVYNFGGGVDDLDIIVGGQSASLERFEFDDQRVELGLGANWISDENFTLGAALDGEVGSSYTSIGGRLRAKFNF